MELCCANLEDKDRTIIRIGIGGVEAHLGSLRDAVRRLYGKKAAGPLTRADSGVWYFEHEAVDWDLVLETLLDDHEKIRMQAEAACSGGAVQCARAADTKVESPQAGGRVADAGAAGDVDEAVGDPGVGRPGAGD